MSVVFIIKFFGYENEPCLCNVLRCVFLLVRTSTSISEMVCDWDNGIHTRQISLSHTKYGNTISKKILVAKRLLYFIQF